MSSTGSATKLKTTSSLPRCCAIRSLNTTRTCRCFSAEIRDASEELLDALILERVFDGRKQDFDTWKSAGADAARLLWEARTERVKLSDFAEEFFRRLAERLGEAMLLRKGELHRLIRFVDPSSIPAEVGEKLDLLGEIFDHANPGEEQPVSS